MTESGRARKLWLAGPAMAGAMLCMGAANPVHSYKDWTAECDNLKSCTAIGFSPESEDSGRHALILTRDAGPAAAVKATLIVESDAKGPQAWRVLVNGRPVASATGKPEAESGLVEAPLAPDQAQALMAAIGNGTSLSVQGPKGEAAKISLAGSSAVLRWIDDVQGRAGGVTALAAKGVKPAASVPAPPALPVVRPAPPQPQTGLAKTPPASLAATVRECREGGGGNRKAEAHRLGPDAVMWFIPCGDGAYNMIDEVVVVDGKGRILPAAVKGLTSGEDGDLLMNLDYDAKAQTLTSFSKGRGLSDCGDETVWAWTGQAFAKISEQTMGECRGLLPNYWPVTYRARVERTGK